MVTCPNCDAVADVGERYCAHCGYALRVPQQEPAPPSSSLERGSSQSGSATSAGIAIGIVASPVLYVAILSFGNVAFGNIGAPPPNTEYFLTKGEAAFDVIVSIVLAISLLLLFIVQPRMKPFLRSFVLTVAFLLLGGFLLCDMFALTVL